MTYNVHQVSEHLADGVERFGPLFSFSTAPFETQHYKVNLRKRGSQMVHMQVANYIQEKSSLRSLKTKVPAFYVE